MSNLSNNNLNMSANLSGLSSSIYGNPQHQTRIQAPTTLYVPQPTAYFSSNNFINALSQGINAPSPGASSYAPQTKFMESNIGMNNVSNLIMDQRLYPNSSIQQSPYASNVSVTQLPSSSGSGSKDSEFIRELATRDFQSGADLIDFLNEHNSNQNGYLHVIQVNDFIANNAKQPNEKVKLLLYFTREIAKIFIEKYIGDPTRNAIFCSTINAQCFNFEDCNISRKFYPICGENVVIAIMRSPNNKSREMTQMLEDFFPPQDNAWNKSEAKGDSITGNFSANCVLKKNNDKFTTVDETGNTRKLQFNCLSHEQRENITTIIKNIIEKMVYFPNLETSKKGKFCEYLSPEPTNGHNRSRTTSMSPGYEDGSLANKKSAGIYYRTLFGNETARSNAPKDLIPRAEKHALAVRKKFKEYVDELFLNGKNNPSILDGVPRYEVKHPRELTSFTNALFKILFSIFPYFISEEFVSIRNTLFRSIEEVVICGKNLIIQNPVSGERAPVSRHSVSVKTAPGVTTINMAEVQIETKKTGSVGPNTSPTPNSSYFIGGPGTLANYNLSVSPGGSTSPYPTGSSFMNDHSVSGEPLNFMSNSSRGNSLSIGSSQGLSLIGGQNLNMESRPRPSQGPPQGSQISSMIPPYSQITSQYHNQYSGGMCFQYTDQNQQNGRQYEYMPSQNVYRNSNVLPPNQAGKSEQIFVNSKQINTSNRTFN